MAKAKIATSRKRVVAKLESDLPDEVMTHLSRLGDHLSKYWKRYIISIALVMAASLAIQAFLESRHESQVAASTEVTDLFQALQGTIATDIKPVDDAAADAPAGEEVKPVVPDFETREARAEDTIKKAESIGEGTDDDLSGLAQAALGRAEMDLKKWSDASKSFAASSEKIADSSLAMILLENQGRAAQASGDASQATDCFTKLTQSSDLYYQVRGHSLLGDLNNPNYAAKTAGGAKTTATEGQSKTARTHYDAALAALVPSEGHVLTVSLKALRSDISRRKALLP